MRQGRETPDGAQIGDRVRDAHLSHFCPGGLGVPLTSPSPAGLELDETPYGPSGHLATPAGTAGRDEQAPCARCGGPLASGQDVRRRSSGGWVHESCPATRPG